MCILGRVGMKQDLSLISNSIFKFKIIQIYAFDTLILICTIHTKPGDRRRACSMYESNLSHACHARMQRARSRSAGRAPRANGRARAHGRARARS